MPRQPYRYTKCANMHVARQGGGVKEHVVFRLRAVRGEGRQARERKAEAYSFQAVKFAAANLVRSLTELTPEWQAKLSNLDAHVFSDEVCIDTIVGDTRLSIRRAPHE